MEIELFINKMKDIYSFLIDFIDATDDSYREFISLIEIFEKHKISKNQEEIILLLSLISELADNHHRMPNFFEKIEKIIQYLTKNVESMISYFMPNYTKYNKRIIFLILEKKFIKPNESFIKEYLQYKSHSEIYYYLYQVMKEFLEEYKNKSKKKF